MQILKINNMIMKILNFMINVKNVTRVVSIVLAQKTTNACFVIDTYFCLKMSVFKSVQMEYILIIL